MNEIVIQKIDSIQRCVARAREEYNAADDFDHDYTHQDAAILNVIRACEQAIDLANHVVNTAKLGVPANTAEAFDLLTREQIVSTELGEKMKRIAQFRNVVVLQYKNTVSLLKRVLESGLDDLIAFGDAIHASQR